MPESARATVVVVSDPHYAGPTEQGRRGHEARAVANPIVRNLLRAYRRFIWLKDPQGHNPMLDRLLEAVPEPVDLAVANGDYSCDTGFIGLADDGALESARLCVERLRARFGDRLELTWGDHELGKLSLAGGAGGLRLASWERGQNELGLRPLWRREMGNYVLLGVVSSLLAWPVFASEALAEERPAWERLRAEHVAAIAEAFAELRPEQRMLLFCHDPTALPFLRQVPEVAARLDRLEATVIGHLHTRQVLRTARRLAGMPTLRFLGNAVRRMSSALNRARHWRAFRVHLCPSPSGCQLLKDGGYLTLHLDPSARAPLKCRFHHLPW